ncbi:alpha/beta hydrolase [Tsukamurella pseudospumae]|uniref:Alpha/beta hydrolase n=1 Tax=Tsukamurella pseudospumae TaxID=239498 RepID=A0A138AQJ7_9ACTN|nr:alpha/beta hydrolase [Tsukamurella pseudospumae]KXP12679.1 alpha/beta hydrolase [Tsukamurella pseudospumae]
MREPVHVTVWSPADPRRRDAAPAIFVHGVFTWGDDAAYGFAGQRPLADERPLLLMDRRGYGLSPDTERSDIDIDADDLVALLDARTTGAHLVGHSNGGLAAMLAAALRPDAVRSLALIQPSALRAAAGHPAVRALLARVGAAADPPHPEIDPTEFLRLSTAGMGMTMPTPTPERLRAVRTSMRERPVWESDPPLAPLAAAPWPSLVITGTWNDAPEQYRRYAGEPLLACADAVAARIGARRLRVPGYYPHTQHPGAVNVALRALWASAG